MVEGKTISIFAMIIVFIALIVLIPYVILIQQTALSSGYTYYDDFSVPSPALLSGSLSGFGKDTHWQISMSGPCKLSYEGSDLVVAGGQGPQTQPCKGRLSTTQNLKGYDLKTPYSIGSIQTGHGSPGSSVSLTLSLNNKDISKVEIAHGNLQPGRRIDELAEITQNRALKDTYNLEINGVESKSIIISEQNVTFAYEFYILNGYVIIKDLQSRPFFNCQVEDDEIVIKDEFIGSQEIDINDLSYHPIKFCTDSFPVLIRDISKGLTPDLRGDITRQLAQGEKINIPEGRVYTIGYIADFIEGIHTKCPLGFAWKKGKCEQYIIEKQDIVEVIRDVRFIEVGIQEVLFTNSGKIGDTTLNSGKPIFSCGNEVKATDSENAPDPREECWNIPISYKGEKVAKYSSMLDLDSYFSVTPFTVARYKQGVVQDGYMNTLILKIKKSFLDVKAKKETPYYFIFNSPQKLCFNIVNNANNFPSAGARVKVQNKLLNEEETKFITFPIQKGQNDYCLDLNNNQIGKFEYNINPYVEIGKKNIFDDQSAVYTLEVVQKIPQETIIINETLGKEIIPKPILINRTLEQRDEELAKENKDVLGVSLIMIILILIILIITGITKRVLNRFR